MTFDWRDYIKIDDANLSYFYDESGQLKDRFDNDFDRPRAEALKRVIETVERTLDQLDDIPAVQELMERGIEAAHLRASELNEIYGDPLPTDARLNLSVSVDHGRTVFTWGTNEVHMNARQIADTSYRSTDGQTYPFSVQGALIDELHHWADLSLTAKRDFENHHGVLKGLVDKFLDDFPEYQEQYQKDGTIAGFDFSQVDDLTNGAELNAFIQSIHPWAQIRVWQDRIDQVGVKQAFEESYAVYKDVPEYGQLLVGAYITQMYDSESFDLRERLDELPAVETHNKIIGESFGLPPRDGYNAIENNEIEMLEYDKIAEEFAGRADHQVISEGDAPEAAPAHEAVPSAPGFIP